MLAYTIVLVRHEVRQRDPPAPQIVVGFELRPVDVVIVRIVPLQTQADRQVRGIGKMRFSLPEHRGPLNAEIAGEIRRDEGVDAMQMLVLFQRVDAGDPVGAVAEQAPFVVRHET